MKFLILCLLLAGVACGDSEASGERSLSNEKAIYRGVCNYRYHFLLLRNSYDRAYFRPIYLSSGKYCYEIIQSPARTYQRYTCSLYLRRYAWFIIRSSTKYYVRLQCTSSYCYRRFTVTVPSNRVYTFLRAGSGYAGSFFCYTQLLSP